MNWLAMTRPGYEPEFCREFRGQTVQARTGSGYAVVDAEAEGRKPWRSLYPGLFTFARQIFMVVGEIEADPADLAGEAAAMLMRWRREERQATGFHSLFLEAPDTNEGRALLESMAGVDEELAERLDRMGLIPSQRRGLPRVNLFLVSRGKAVVGVSDPVTGTPWPMGAPKFELPAEAPSRSARKLEEAIEIFIPEGERLKRFKGGMRAVDLGASPGGWTWQLSRRGLIVEAVDNGGLDPVVFDYGLVTHIKADGYSFRPKRPVDWLTCDIVGGAQRIARLVANWVERSLMREAIFNLKLGEGDRTRQVEQAKRIITDAAKKAGVYVQMRLKHLYHDRDEVTAHLVVTGREKMKEEERGPRVEKVKDGSGGRRGGRSKTASSKDMKASPAGKSPGGRGKKAFGAKAGAQKAAGARKPASRGGATGVRKARKG